MKINHTEEAGTALPSNGFNMQLSRRDYSLEGYSCEKIDNDIRGSQAGNVCIDFDCNTT